MQLLKMCAERVCFFLNVSSVPFRSRHLRSAVCIIPQLKVVLLFTSTEFLHKMLNASYSQLNNMFTRTYGLHYNQNAQLFVDFYARMRKYLDGKEDNVTQIVDALFNNMGKKMINMLHVKDRMANANTYQFRYPMTSVISCLTKNFHGAQAYGTGPDTLKKNLIRSLTAGRTLAMVLAVQREALATVMKKVNDFNVFFSFQKPRMCFAFCCGLRVASVIRCLSVSGS